MKYLFFMQIILQVCLIVHKWYHVFHTSLHVYIGGHVP